MIPRQSNHVTRFVGRLGPSLYRKLNQRNIQNVDVIYDYMMRQLAHESDYGRSKVAVNQHNYGGYGWNGETYTTFNSDDEFLDSYLDIMQGRHKDALGAQNITQYAKSLKDTNYFEAPLEEYVGSLNGMKSLGRVLASHRVDNPDLYTVNQVPQESELVQQLRASQWNPPIKPEYKNGKLPGYFMGFNPNTVRPLVKIADSTLRNRMYKNILPMDYDRPVERFINGAILDRPEAKGDHGQPSESYKTIDNLWGEYLGIPHNQRKYQNSKDGLTVYTENGKRYVSLNNPHTIFGDIVDTTQGILRKHIKPNGDWYWEDSPQAQYGQNKNVISNFILGDFQTMRKVDPRQGEYIQYTDRWDINPYQKTENVYGQVPYKDMPWYDKVMSKIVNKYIEHNPDKDATFGFGNPLDVKGKIYLEDVYGAPKGSTAPDSGDYFGGWLPEVSVIKHRKNK